ncbi:unnamed protein product [Bathycoccus prasinos]
MDVDVENDDTPRTTHMKRDDPQDLVLLQNCDLHLTRLQNQLEDLSNPSFVAHIDDEMVLKSMREETTRSMEKFKKIRAKITCTSSSDDEKRSRRVLNVSEWSSDEVKLQFTRDRIRRAFKTDEIYLLFFEKDRNGLRDRLDTIERESRLLNDNNNKNRGNKGKQGGREGGGVGAREKLEGEKIEILVALKNLGEKLTEVEKLYLREGLERGAMEDLEMLDGVV